MPTDHELLHFKVGDYIVIKLEKLKNYTEDGEFPRGQVVQISNMISIKLDNPLRDLILEERLTIGLPSAGGEYWKSVVVINPPRKNTSRLDAFSRRLKEKK